MRRVLLFSAGVASVLASLPGVAAATSTTCSTSTVCAEYINTYAYSSGATTGGVAIHGEANSGIGIRGTSVSNVGFYGASGSGTYLSPGVEGESTNQSGQDLAAGFGLADYLAKTSAPALGVFAFGEIGLQGATANPGTKVNVAGFGVEGADLVSAASGAGDTNAGVAGYSSYGTAVLANAGGDTMSNYGSEPVGVFAQGFTMKGTLTAGATALVGQSDSVGLELLNTSYDGELEAATTSDFLIGSANAGEQNQQTIFYINLSGDEYLNGTLTTSKGGPYVRTTGSSGTAVREYTDRTTTPQVEDFGEAQLVNGRAYVPIDARLADTIDRHVSYLVFLTPAGDCKGLFVTQKSAAGFVVRELQGGRSSLPFEYRIVAKPIDDNGTRLAAMPAETLPKELGIRPGLKTGRGGQPLSLQDDLKRRLGPQGYAKAVAAMRTRLAGR